MTDHEKGSDQTGKVIADGTVQNKDETPRPSPSSMPIGDTTPGRQATRPDAAHKAPDAATDNK